MNDRSASEVYSFIGVFVLFLSVGGWLTIQINDRSEDVVAFGAMLFCAPFGLAGGVWRFANDLWGNRRWSGFFLYLPSVVVLQILIAWLLNGFSASPPFPEAAVNFGIAGLILGFGIYLLEITGAVNILGPRDESGKVEPEVAEVFNVMGELVLDELGIVGEQVQDELGIDRNALRQRFPTAQRNQFFDPHVTQVSWDSQTILVIAMNNFVYQQLPPLIDDWFYQKARRLLMAALLRSRGCAARGLGKEPGIEVLIEGESERVGCTRWLGWAVLAPLRLVWLAIRWVLTPLKILLIPISLPLAIRTTQSRILFDFLLFHSVDRVFRHGAVQSAISTQEALVEDAHRIRRAYEDAEHETDSKLFRAVIRALLAQGTIKASYAMAVQRFKVIMAEEGVGSYEGDEESDPKGLYKLAKTWIRALEEALEEPEIRAWLVEFDQRFDQALAAHCSSESESEGERNDAMPIFPPGRGTDAEQAHEARLASLAAYADR